MRTVQDAIPPCRHLRNKKMYVPGQAAEALIETDQPGAFAQCWCNITMTETGADDDLAGIAVCSDPARSCYKVF